MSTALARLPTAARSTTPATLDAFDPARFDQMQRLANMMSHSTLVPDHLRKGPREEAIANCFLVVNQAMRWGMDPFAVGQATSVISGKLVYEGKLVAAVIASQLGVRLKYKWDGPAGTDKRRIEVSGDIDGSTCTITGTVADWKTTRAGSPWQPGRFDQMLAYRGAREWARLYAPDVMLGVYAPDEMDEDKRPMRDITPARTIAEPPKRDDLYVDQAGYLAHLEEEMADMDAAELKEAWDAHVANSQGRLDAAHAVKALHIYEAAAKRIGKAP